MLTTGKNLGLLDNGEYAEQSYFEMLRLMRGLDVLVQPHVISRTTDLPEAFAEGDAYIVPVGATDVWAGKDNLIARWTARSAAITPQWEFFTPKLNWVFGVDDDTSVPFVRWDGSAWVVFNSGGGGTGTPGTVWRVGAGTPSNTLGINGDFYLNSSNGDVHQKAGGIYGIVANIRGPAGEDGPPGVQGDDGTPGTVWRSGPGAPSNTLGVNGDYYLNVTNGDVYLKSSGSYSLDGNIRGPAGSSGAGTGDMLKSVYDPNDDGKVTSAAQADSVPWAGVTNPPTTMPPSAHSHATSEVTGLDSALTGKIASSEKGAANGVAPLGADSKIASTYLPSYVDDVIEAANFAALPGTGESGKIYVTIDNGKTFRWSGSAYAEISASPGSTDAVTEGASNLYFTYQRVRDTVLTGLSLAVSTAISATDSVLVALGKLQAQINGKANTTHSHATSEVTGLDTALAGKAATGHNHTGTYEPVDVNIVRKNTANTFNATQTPDNGTASVSATGAYAFDGADQVREITLTNAIAVTFNAPTGIVQHAMYKFVMKAGDTSARTFAWNAAYKFPGGASPLTSGTATLNAYDTITFIGGSSNTLIYDGHSADVR